MPVDGSDRFARGLERLAPGGTRVLLAVSGGADSMAMLALAHAACPDRIAVATVDHRLHPEGAEAAAIVARTCTAFGLRHATLTPLAAIEGASLQAQARSARYALLGAHAAAIGAVAVATAHHADDQAETFLMRAARGAGLSGLAGIRACVTIEGISVVRPLLEWRRAGLHAIVRRAGLDFVDDPANRDDRHDRTRFRALLQTNGWLDPDRIARSAAVLADVDRDLRAFVDWLWDARARVGSGEVRLDMRDLPRDLRRRLAIRAVSAVRDAAAIDAPGWSEAMRIEPLLDALEQGRRATQAGVLGSVVAGTWRFRVAPPRRHG